MEKTLLVQTLLAFSPSERPELRRFLTDSYFNRGKHALSIVQLFNLLDAKISGSGPVDWDKNRCMAEFFVEHKGQAGYFNNLMSELLALIRQFILVQEIQGASGQPIADLATARFYRQRGLVERARQTLFRAKTHLAKPPLQWLLRTWREQEIFLLESHSTQRQEDLHLPAVLEAMTVCYAENLLPLAAVLAQQERLVPGQRTGWSEWATTIRTMLKHRQHFGQATLLVFDRALEIIELESNSPQSDIEQFLELLEAHEQQLSSDVLKSLAAFARNCCSRHTQQGWEAGASMQFALYQRHLAKGWLYENGLLQPSTLINMVTTGLRQQEYQWVWDIVQEHQGRVANDEEAAAWRYCLANYHFYLGNFGAVQHYTLVPKSTDIEIEKLMRLLSIKAAFEEDPQNEFLASQLHNFDAFLRRNRAKLVLRKRQQNAHFIAMVRRLIQVVESAPTPGKKAALRQQRIQFVIENISNPQYELAERGWLRAKISALSAAKGPTQSSKG